MIIVIVHHINMFDHYMSWAMVIVCRFKKSWRTFATAIGSFRADQEHTPVLVNLHVVMSSVDDNPPSQLDVCFDLLYR